jgi:beta-lactamase class A
LADTLPALFAEQPLDPDRFSATFLVSVPVQQVATLTAQLRTQYGAPQAVERKVGDAAGYSGMVVVRFEHALVHCTLAADVHGKIIGLHVVNIAPINDSVAALESEMRSLPGTVAWGVYQLDSGIAPRLLAGSNTSQDMAVGSVFKLAILGALDEQIAQGHMRWTDTITLSQHTVPSSRLLRWPDNAPLTLYSLAAMMISDSDNRATDVLLHHLGRARVEDFARRNGGLSGPNAFPLLSTLEATVLKNPHLGPARQSWLSGNETTRRQILTQYGTLFTHEHVNMDAYAAGPADIGSIEWFASPDAVARIHSWFAHHATREAREILSINPGIPEATAGEWRYLGYKGGSEPGVLAFSFILQDANHHYAVTLTWNNPAAEVEEPRFLSYALRMLALTKSGAFAVQRVSR